jgi:adenosylcobinamide-GDP ribazoletransferase
MKSILTAVVFLTRVRFPIEAGADDVSRAARWFPLVGAVLGAVGAVIATVLAEAPRLPPAMGALLMVSLWVWVTGAIHADGVADVADGFGGGRTTEDVLRIMRDPRLGSFGVLALIFIVGLKVAALTTLWERHVLFPFLIATPAMARWTPVALGVWLPYARSDEGIGQAAVRRSDWAGLAVATATTASVAVLAVGFGSLVLGSVTVLVTVAMGKAARRRIGGLTGDVFGACVELTEVALLSSAVLMTAQC